MAVVEPVQTAAERAHRRLRAEILDGLLAPGTMLSESELAASLSMSRTPVRAALVRLQDEGWVTVYPKRGAMVRELTQREVTEAAQLRCALETAGVQHASAADRGGLARSLAANLADQKVALDDGDFGAFTALSLEFHRAFAALPHNALLLSAYDRVRDRQHLSIVRSAPVIAGAPRTVLREHRALLRSCASDDWAAFGDALRAHQERSNTL